MIDVPPDATIGVKPPQARDKPKRPQGIHRGDGSRGFDLATVNHAASKRQNHIMDKPSVEGGKNT